ncbi:MAG: hypothetical protein IJS90_10290 [Clostridia bacterium]|nr:hypothetical protein [Clostridia bacterium]
MDFSKKALRTLIIYLMLLFAAGVLTVVDMHYQLGIPRHTVRSVLENAVFLHWLFSVRRRFPQRQMRRQVTLFVAAFMILNLMMTAKYDFTQQDSAVQRYLWYAYYITFVFGPLFMFHASLYFGKPDDYVISKRWNWTYLPPAIISIGVLTNDWHQLAFRFDSGLEHWNDDYSHGIIYHMAAIWMLAMLLGVITLAVRATRGRRLFKTAWLPLAVLAVAALYRLKYGFLPGNAQWWMQEMYEFPEFVCLGSIAVWESFVISRIIVSNNAYPAIFAASSLRAGLADRGFQVRRTSAQAIRPTPEQLEAAKENDIVLPDGDTLLKARHVHGGLFYWTEDIAELRRLREELNDTADYLSEENAMLRMSAEIEEGRKKTAEQTKLYDDVTEALRPQLKALRELMEAAPKDEAAFQGTMQKAALMLAFAKRRSNLLLLSGSSRCFDGEEIGLCLEESAKVLRLSGKPCEVSVDDGLSVTSRTADRLYTAFERAAELAFPTLRCAAVSLLRAGDDRVMLEMTLETPDGQPLARKLSDVQQSTDDVSVDLSDEKVIYRYFPVNRGYLGEEDGYAY